MLRLVPANASAIVDGAPIAFAINTLTFGTTAGGELPRGVAVRIRSDMSRETAAKLRKFSRTPLIRVTSVFNTPSISATSSGICSSSSRSSSSWTCSDSAPRGFLIS